MTQEPIDHHYLPKFYLSRWCNDGELCRYSRPWGPQVVAKRITPRGTAFEPRLYENTGLPMGRRQSMEIDFFQKVDDRAATALELLESGAFEKKDWSPKMRSNWSRFLLTQQMRAPEDIDQMKESVRHERRALGPFVFRYPPGSSMGGQPSEEEVRQADEAENDRFALTILRNMMDNKTLGQMLNDMHWRVLEVPPHESTLVTSDRPIWMTSSLAEPQAFLVMPIGPRRLFAASKEPATDSLLEGQPRNELVSKVNEFIAAHAAAYVFADDDSKLPNLAAVMFTKQPLSLMARLAEKRGHALVPRRRPARP